MPQTEWTTTKLLDWMTGYLEKAGVETARLRSELLLSHVLGVQRIMLYISTPVAADKLALLKDCLRQAAEHKPIEYIIGHTTFYSMTILVSADTLIPRPETEELVRYAIDELRQRELENRKVLDLCTGSGCIAAAIAKGAGGSKIVATDISAEALAVAEKNFTLCGVAENVQTLCGDLFTPLKQSQQFDVIVSNPPYITTSEYTGLDKNVRDYEPANALLAGDDGLDFYRRIAAESGDYLKADGKLMLEIGYQQADDVGNLLTVAGFKDIKMYKDFADNPRVIICNR